MSRTASLVIDERHLDVGDYLMLGEIPRRIAARESHAGLTLLTVYVGSDAATIAYEPGERVRIPRRVPR